MAGYVPIAKGKDDNKREVDNGKVAQFLRNAVTDVRELAPALIMGPILLGRDMAVDFASVPFGDTDFSRTTETLTGAAKGFIDESPVVSLGDMVVPGGKGFGDAAEEAISRFNKRPVSGALDIGGTASVIRNVAGRTAKNIARGVKGAEQEGLMKYAGYEYIRPFKKGDELKVAKDLKYRYAEDGIKIGDSVYARPTHRRMAPSYNDPALLKDPTDLAISSKLPRESYYDLGKGNNIPADLSKRLESADAWKRVSRNPWWRKTTEGIAEIRRRTIKADSAFSSSKARLRKERRGVEVVAHTAPATARALHEGPNRDYINSLADDMKKQGVAKDTQIELIADWAAYLSAMGYNSTKGHFEDLINTHERDFQNYRKVRKKKDQIDLLPSIVDLRNRITTEGPNTPNGKAMRLELGGKMKLYEKARSEGEASANYLKKREQSKPYGRDDPRSGYKERVRELTPIASLVDRAMSSPYIEKWLDDMELASQSSEQYAMKNYGFSLPKEEMVQNRFRAADLYTKEGATNINKRRYMRKKLGKDEYRTPIFMPMFDKKRDAITYQEGKVRNPLSFKDESLLPDPMDLELWGKNVTKPVTKATLMRKHASEIQEFEYNKIMKNIRRQAIPMSKKKVAQLEDTFEFGESQNIISRLNPDTGLPLDPKAQFYALGEFATRSDTVVASMKSFGDDLTRGGYIEEGNMIRKMARDRVLKAKNMEGKMLTGKNLSARQIEQAMEFETGMDVILPAKAYGSLIRDMIETTDSIVKMIEIPEMARSAGKAMATGMKYWRYSILHTRPKWMVNNAIGSVYMLAMQEGWVKAFTDILKNSSLFNKAKEFLGVEKNRLERGGDRFTNEIIESRFSNVLYAQGSSAMFGFSERGKGISGKFTAAMDWIADFNAKVADNPARSARIRQIIDQRLRNRKQAMRESGEAIRKTDDQMIIEMLDDIEIREDIATIALEDMIDFQDLTNAERKLIAYAVPFWSWIKGSSKATVRHAADRSGRMVAQSYLGKEASSQLEDQFPGGLPSYLLSSLPGGFFGDSQRGVVNFAGVAPAQSLGDMISMAAWLSPVGSVPMQFGTESPLGMMNPAITGSIAAMTRRHPFYGTPIGPDKTAKEIFFDVAQPPFWRSQYKGFGGKLLGQYPWSRPTWLGGEPFVPTDTTISEYEPRSYAQRLVMPHAQTIVPEVASERAREERIDLGFAK